MDPIWFLTYSQPTVKQLLVTSCLLLLWKAFTSIMGFKEQKLTDHRMKVLLCENLSCLFLC